MTTATVTIDDYLIRLRDLAGSCNHVDRFYLFMEDEQLAGWEYELGNSGEAQLFYDRLLEQYRAWKDAMAPKQWAEVVAYNDALNGANQNHLLVEV